MKIINVSKKPFEWTFNSGNYGPIGPGQIMDLPYEIAAHAVKRSISLRFEEDGTEIYEQQIQLLSSVSGEEIKNIALYPCPMSVSGQCDKTDFKSLDELREHMNIHWGAPAVLPDKNPKSAGASLKAL